MVAVCSLSAAEDRAGLFENSSLIGFRLNWERLLESRDLTLDGHRLVGLVNSDSKRKVEPTSPISVPLERHRTALTRYDLSKPAKTLIEFDQLEPGCSFFDYGCGSACPAHPAVPEDPLAAGHTSPPAASPRSPGGASPTRSENPSTPRF